MHQKQHTVKGATTLSGVGLHTGTKANLTFKPASVNHGIRFKRIDLEEQPEIPADVDFVVDTSRGTTLEANGARVHTVEHVLAALVGMQVDNILIELDGPEIPIMDGSSLEFVKALEQVGLDEQALPRNFFEIPESVFYKDDTNKIELAALPSKDYRVTVMVDYNSPVLGSQHASLNDITQFSEEIASSRTFCFLHEVEMLRKNNLIKGGDFNNAIVVVDKVIDEEELQDLAELFNVPKVEVKKEGILNNVELRYNNEPARHKLLDIVGDLALAGRPLKGQILAARPGHSANVAFARKLKRLMQQVEKKQAAIPTYDPTQPAIMDINQISHILPHEYPFKLVDKIIQLDKDSVTGVKNVTINEPFFVGHFPKNPVMPGVLQVEAMAQTGGILALNTVDNPESYWAYFLGIEDCKFRKMVIPGDTLIIRCELLMPIRRGIAKMKGQIFVADKLVCEATVSASLVKKDQ